MMIDIIIKFRYIWASIAYFTFLLLCLATETLNLQISAFDLIKFEEMPIKRHSHAVEHAQINLPLISINPENQADPEIELLGPADNPRLFVNINHKPHFQRRINMRQGIEQSQFISAIARS